MVIAAADALDETLVMDKPWNGARLRDIREQAGISQTELARLLDMWQGAIGNWERGDRKPNVDDLYTLCDVFGCSCADFYRELGVRVRFRHKPRSPKTDDDKPADDTITDDGA